MQKFTRSLFAVGAVLGLAACGDDISVTPPTPPPAATIASVTVVPASITIATGEKVILTASVTTTQGTGSPATTVTWTSANPVIASVIAGTGEVTGVSVGTTTIRATSTADAGKVGAAAVTVRSPAVRGVTVTPSALALQIGQSATAVATVDRDVGAIAGVTWSTNAPAVATVDSTGKIVAVSAGTAVITATSKADVTKAAALAVTVTAVPNNLTALTVAPTNAGLGVGGTVQLVANATTIGSPTVTYTYASSNTAVATVSSTGLVTAVGNGTAIITTTATTNTNSLSASTTIGVASASVSISSITQNNLPVTLSSVAGQFEVTMNIAAGNQTLDSVRVTLGGKAAATQTFTVNGAPNAPVTLSINSADYKINNVDSTAAVSFLNGSTGVQAQLFTQGAAGPTASNTITITLTNTDTFHARWTLPTLPKTSAAGFLWYGGPNTSTFVNVVPVMYSGNTITQATIFLDDASLDGFTAIAGTTAQTDASSPFTALFLSTGITPNVNVQPGVSASLRADGNAGPSGVLAIDPAGGVVTTPFANAAAITTIRLDGVGPSGAFDLTGVAPNNWIGGPTVASSNWHQYVTGVTDGAGVGASDSTFYVFEYEDRAITGAVWVANAANPSNVPENAVDFTNSAYNERVTLKDRLGNATIVYLGGGVTPGVRNYGVDVTAPEIFYLTVAQQPRVVLPVSDTTSLTRILHDVVLVTAPVALNSTNALFGVRMRDTRSGFDTLAAGTLSGLFKQIVRFAPPGPGTTTCAFGGTACAFVRDTARVDITDPTFRRDTIAVYGSLTASTPGYYTYSAYSVDRALNRSLSTITRQIAIDVAAPIITGLPVPASLVGAQPLSIIPTGLDDLEVWKAAGYLNYPNMGAQLHFPFSILPVYGTPFDNVLATPVGFLGVIGAAGVTLPINFLRGIDLVQGADSAPPAAVSATYAPNSMGAQFYDIKRSTTAFTAATPDSSGVINSIIPAGLVAPGVPFSAVGVGKWYIFGAGTTGSTIQARALTQTVITNAPFPQVAFFRLSGGTWTYLGQVTSVPGTNPTSFDSGTNRFWTYTLTGVSPALATGNVIRAIGMSVAGDGLSTLDHNQP